MSRGSQVYEIGHILVLAWADTQRDREVIWKILSQVLNVSSSTTAKVMLLVLCYHALWWLCLCYKMWAVMWLGHLYT